MKHKVVPLLILAILSCKQEDPAELEFRTMIRSHISARGSSVGPAAWKKVTKASDEELARWHREKCETIRSANARGCPVTCVRGILQTDFLCRELGASQLGLNLMAQFYQSESLEDYQRRVSEVQRRFAEERGWYYRIDRAINEQCAAGDEAACDLSCCNYETCYKRLSELAIAISTGGMKSEIDRLPSLPQDIASKRNSFFTRVYKDYRIPQGYTPRVRSVVVASIPRGGKVYLVESHPFGNCDEHTLFTQTEWFATDTRGTLDTYVVHIFAIGPASSSSRALVIHIPSRSECPITDLNLGVGVDWHAILLDSCRLAGRFAANRLLAPATRITSEPLFDPLLARAGGAVFVIAKYDFAYSDEMAMQAATTVYRGGLKLADFFTGTILHSILHTSELVDKTCDELIAQTIDNFLCRHVSPEDLAVQFAPILITSEEDMPQDPNSFVSACKLRHGNKNIPSSQIPSHLQHPEDRLFHPAFGPDGRRPSRITTSRPLIFAHVVEDQPSSWYIQYWLFYPFNDADFNIGGQHIRQRHVGDWELVQVTVLFKGRRPHVETVTVSQHWWYWTYDFSTTGSEHPRVLVASGSHALYLPGSEVLTCGIEHFPQQDKIRILQPSRDYDIVVFKNQPWLGFKGRWGQTNWSWPDLPSNSGPLTFYTDSPRGPWEKKVWSSPEWVKTPGRRDDPELGLGEAAIQTAFRLLGLAPGMTHDEFAKWIGDVAACVGVAGAVRSTVCAAAAATVKLEPWAVLSSRIAEILCQWLANEVCKALLHQPPLLSDIANATPAEVKKILLENGILKSCPNY